MLNKRTDTMMLRNLGGSMEPPEPPLDPPLIISVKYIPLYYCLI